MAPNAAARGSAKSQVAYERGCKGWVIVNRDAKHPGSSSWWYGPHDGWGNTWGRLDPSVAVFSSRRAAEQAFRSLQPLRGGRTAQRVADAEREQVAALQERLRQTARPEVRAAIVRRLAELGALKDYHLSVRDEIQMTALTRAEDMDRDGDGHLTDLGREQLAEWHRLVGLLPDEPDDLGMSTTSSV